MDNGKAKYAEMVAVNDKCQITPLMSKFAIKILCPLGIVLPVQWTSMGCPLDIPPSLTRLVPLSYPVHPFKEQTIWWNIWRLPSPPLPPPPPAPTHTCLHRKSWRVNYPLCLSSRNMRTPNFFFLLYKVSNLRIFCGCGFVHNKVDM